MLQLQAKWIVVQDVPQYAHYKKGGVFRVFRINLRSFEQQQQQQQQMEKSH